MENKTRKQLVREEKNKLILEAVKDGFYLFEVGEMFKLSEGRICQIVNEANEQNNSKIEIKK